MNDPLTISLLTLNLFVLVAGIYALHKQRNVVLKKEAESDLARMFAKIDEELEVGLAGKQKDKSNEIVNHIKIDELEYRIIYDIPAEIKETRKS